jgi:hypothetical protein
VYSSIPREQIADTLIHLRGLFREIPPSSEKDDRAQERREILTKNLLSNLSHATCTSPKPGCMPRRVRSTTYPSASFDPAQGGKRTT